VSDDGVVFGYMGQPKVAGIAQSRRAVWVDGIPYWISENLDVANGAPYSACVAMNQQGQILTNGPYAPQGIGGWVLNPNRRLPADLDGDCIVDGADLGALLKSWGPRNDQSTGADLNADGVVDGEDLGILLGQWTDG
jgi:hypothetical protein